MAVDTAQWLVLPAAIVMDALVGDPRILPHPIRWMGKSIQVCEPLFRRSVKNQRLAGTLFALVLIIGCWGVTTLVMHTAQAIHPVADMGVEVVLIFFCLSARSLWQAAMAIYRLLNNGQTDRARAGLAMIVGRDVARYGADDISRATVETVAENFVDGILSPLFFVVLGGAPLAMAYKMINTLDSMVGYKNERYRQFGWAAARIDDAANFIPARLSILIICLAAWVLAPEKGARAFQTAIKEGAHHSSPNAGYPEAAFGGALGVKLNGPNDYNGVRVDKPYVGVAFGPAGRRHIQKACELMMAASLVASVLSWAVWLVVRV